MFIREKTGGGVESVGVCVFVYVCNVIGFSLVNKPCHSHGGELHAGLIDYLLRVQHGTKR